MTTIKNNSSLIINSSKIQSDYAQERSTNSEFNDLENLISKLRHTQKDLGMWKGGQMAVSAVPGAGKSYTLSVAAAIAIKKYQLNQNHFLVIVTYTRSAAASIKQKIQENLRLLGLPLVGFQVQTLHGLALNIATQHPELSQLNLDYSTLIIPRPSHRVIRECVEEWISHNPDRFQKLIEGQNNFDGEESERLRRQSVLRTDVLPQLAYNMIREAKSSNLSSSDVSNLSIYSKDDIYDVLEIAGGLYLEYEQLMRKNNFIDYDDMILASLRVLEDEKVRKMWQKQVFAVFEDEAQDSSPLQGKLIKILATNSDSEVNLIRVGDPNQAINSTFTTADPVYFNLFCDQCESSDNNQFSTMNEAGRSCSIIIDAANLMLKWVNQQWVNQQFEEEYFPFREQEITLVENTAENSTNNQNPPPEGKGLEIHTPDDIYHTIELIGDRVTALLCSDRIINLLQEDSQKNVAILVRENKQGKFVEEKLKEYWNKEEKYSFLSDKIKLISEFENYSHIPLEMLKLLNFIDRPHSSNYLQEALEILQERKLIKIQNIPKLSENPETFLYPTVIDAPQTENVKQARKYLCNLLKARLELPHYQLMPFIAMTLEYEGSELATIEKLSERVNQEIIGKSSLKTTITALREIVKSERFEGVEEENDDIYTKKGQITIMTMHKAKGLDWDYVFIPFLHQDSIPGKPYVGKQMEFLGNYTLSEIARAQLRFAVHKEYQGQKIDLLPSPEEAWQDANKLKQAEEYRLLYVAMTRAKRLLWMSASQKAPFLWNMFKDNGSSNFSDKKPCPVIPILKQKLEV